MYLARSLSWNGANHAMVGVLDAEAVMHERPQGRGYVVLEEDRDRHPWPLRPAGVETLQAHEFHYSALQGLGADSRYAYRVLRGTGIGQQRDGYVYRNLLASYTHLRNTAANPWVKRFLQFAQQHKSASTANVSQQRRVSP
jgi:cobyrinic acid a,c-diamide synthase